MKLVNRNFFLINFILLSFIAFVYFWDIKSSLIQIRFLIILLIFPYFFLSENRINSIVYFFFPVLFIFIHLITVSNILDIKINIQRIYEIFFLYYFLVISYAYKEIILNYLNQFILIFLLIFYLSITFHFFKKPESINFIISCYQGWFSLNNFLFLENSHFGMISSSILWYSVFRLFDNKINFISKFLLLIFIFFSFINISTSFLFNIIIISFLALFFCFKKIHSKEFLVILFLLIVSIFILIFEKQCAGRFFDTVKSVTSYFTFSEKLYKRIEGKIAGEEVEVRNFNPNMSTSIYVNSQKVMIFALKENILGFGLNQYYVVHEKYFIKNKDQYNFDIEPYLLQLNKQDASNNFVKLVCEFGIFSIFIFYFILKLLMNNTPLFLKFFFLAPLISQLFLRGAGYFNGGFIFFLFFTIILSFKNNRKII